MANNKLLFGLAAMALAGASIAVIPSSPKAVANSTRQIAESHHADEVADTTCSELSDRAPVEKSTVPGKITSLVDFYLHGHLTRAAIDPGSLPDGLHFIVVTLPDPLHTHLNLNFDRTIEAIQQAAQDEGYTYDSSWLPWKQQATEYSSLADQIADEQDTIRREHCPGLILFRRNIQLVRERDGSYTKGLFLFLVSEKPTTGLNRIQWDNALQWIARHASKNSDGALRVLGPTFSGSVSSVARAVTDAGQAGYFNNVLLYSGTVRGCSAFKWLDDEVHAPGIPIRTSDFDENDAIQIDRYFRYLTDRGHSLSEVAILSEDETTYGGLPDARKLISNNQQSKGSNPDRPTLSCEPTYSKDRPLHLYYPRDISALRSAYQEQSIFASTNDVAASAHVVLQPQASASTHHDTDTVPNFSGANLALAEEAQMYGIVDSLGAHGIRFVILRSTSTLDYLFLTRFLHRAYADAFIVTMGPDILFGREVDSTEFRGVASLTAYPLLPRGQDWTLPVNSTPRHAHRIFGSNSMEGTYIAVRFLITDPKAGAGEPRPYIHPSKQDIPDYQPPFWTFARPQPSVIPSTWLSVVGRNGYWPVAILTAPYTTDESLRSNLAIVAAPNEDDLASDRSSAFELSLSPPWKLCCVLVVLAVLLHFFGCRYGWRHQDLSMFTQFAPLPENRQLFLLSIAWAVVGSILVFMFLCSARIETRGFQSKDSVWVWLLAAVIFFGLYGIARDIGWRSSAKTGRLPARLPRAILWIIFPLMIVAAAAWVGWNIFDFSDPNGVPTAYRSVHLASGVSPMVSVLLMLLGFYAWFWQALAGLSLLGEGRPILPPQNKMPVALARLSDGMARNIEKFAVPIPDFGIGQGFFYLFPSSLLLLELLALRHSSPGRLDMDLIVHSLESGSFHRLLLGLFAVAFFLVVLDCSQLLTTWLSLKRLLLALNRTPLRRTFSHLQGLSMRSLWGMSGTSSRTRYTIFSHQLESLHHLRNVMRDVKNLNFGNDSLRDAIDLACEQGRSFIDSRSTTPDLAMINDASTRKMRVDFCECAVQLFNDLLLPQWFQETSSLDLAENGDKADPSERLPLSSDEPIRRAEEFVCLIYIGYLQNLIARMRTMVLSMLAVFATAAFSVAFYPYTPRPGMVLSLLAILLGLGSVVAFVYAGLSRDATLSYITNTEPGSLGWDFWARLAGFIGVPAMGLLAAQFPGITDFVLSWVEPGLNAVK